LSETCTIKKIVLYTKREFLATLKKKEKSRTKNQKFLLLLTEAEKEKKNEKKRLFFPKTFFIFYKIKKKTANRLLRGFEKEDFFLNIKFVKLRIIKFFSVLSP